MLNIDGIGRLTKRIQLLSYQDVVDEYGLTHQDLVPVLPYLLWARIEPLRGREYLVAYKEQQEELVKITIRYLKGITPSMLVNYRGKLYEIISVINPYEGNVKLELMCRFRKVGDDGGGDES